MRLTRVVESSPTEPFKGLSAHGYEYDSNNYCVTCVVTECSVPEIFLFLIHVNSLRAAFVCGWFAYVDNLKLFVRHPL